MRLGFLKDFCTTIVTLCLFEIVFLYGCTLKSKRFVLNNIHTGIVIQKMYAYPMNQIETLDSGDTHMGAVDFAIWEMVDVGDTIVHFK